MGEKSTTIERLKGGICCQGMGNVCLLYNRAVSFRVFAFFYGEIEERCKINIWQVLFVVFARCQRKVTVL